MRGEQVARRVQWIAASAPIFGAPPKPAMRPDVKVELLPARSICKVDPMNMSQA
jgi:hypothetical protein